MSIFNRIEAREDCEAARLELEAETMKIARANLLACPHRRHTSLVGITCRHPERTRGRGCVNFECPVIDFI
jgi:hypothetical protein